MNVLPTNFLQYLHVYIAIRKVLGAVGCFLLHSLFKQQPFLSVGIPLELQCASKYGLWM